MIFLFAFKLFLKFAFFILMYYFFKFLGFLIDYTLALRNIPLIYRICVAIKNGNRKKTVDLYTVWSLAVARLIHPIAYFIFYVGLCTLTMYAFGLI